MKIKNSVFNEAYLPYLEDDSRYLVFYGGAGSGKSVFIAQRFIYRLLTRPLCNVLVVRQVAETNRDSTFALLTQVINRWGLTRYFKINRSNLQITAVTGNTIIFKGLDDPEKLKSITFPRGELTDVWIEEATEALEESLNQLDFRLRGGNTKKQTVLSFNPISVNHWLKKRFFDKKNPKVKVLKTTYKDNKFLSKEDIELYESYKEVDPYYYAVYCLGEWGVYGKTVFKAINVQEQLNKEIKPVKVGYFDYRLEGDKISDITFVEDNDNGYIKIYEDAIKGHPYVVGGDTAGEGSDWFIGAVIDNATKKQVAMLRHQFDEDIYSNQMYCLGKYFNDALVGVESNYSTYPVKRLEMLGYTNMYVREREDTYTHKLVQSYGFKTTKLTRPSLIAGLVEIVRETPELIVDEDTLLEMLTFVRNEKGRPEAQNGAHDDCIMALGIAYAISNQQTEEAETEEKVKKVKWEADQWEDYNRGTEEERRMMVELWGEPE